MYFLKNKKILVFIAAYIFSSYLYVSSFTAHANASCGTADACERAERECRQSGGAWNNTAGTCGEYSSGVSDEDGQRLVDWINLIVNLLSALTGIAIAGSVIFAGIQYSTAGGNPQASAQAKKRISQAITALLAYVFIYSFLQWLVPGGIF